MTKKSKNPLLAIVEGRLYDSKAEDITKLDLAGIDSICEYMYIVSGNSNRHVKSIAHHLVRALKNTDIDNIAVEGTENCQWVLIDIGDIIIHIFQPEARLHYRLEEIWKKKKS